MKKPCPKCGTAITFTRKDAAILFGRSCTGKKKVRGNSAYYRRLGEIGRRNKRKGEK